jgi:Cthe_2314-like HEPN
MDDLQKFRDFDQVVRNLYDTVPLTTIEDLTFGDKNSVTFFSDVLRQKQNLQPFPYSDFKIYDELLFISKDIKYYTALLYFFKPHITDSSFDGTYFQTLEDRRYMMFASICFQSVYNFWDRIGDLLNLYFHTGLREDAVYYSRVLNNFPNQYKTSDNYVWLHDTYEAEVKNFLGQRNDIVHSYQLECEYYWKIMELHPDLDEIKKVQEEKESFPEKFKRQIDLTKEAFSRTLKLIEELPDRVNTP